MKTKIQIKTVFGKLLFEHESENNSTKKTLEQARKEGANLQGAYLQWANLQGADLQWANLQGADLQWANLQGANLQWANLQGADLQGANLKGADLQGANLPIFCKWGHYIREGKIHIGCESKTPKEWIEWLESEKEYETKRGTLEFKRIEATIRAYCSYVDVMGEDLYPKTKDDETAKV